MGRMPLSLIVMTGRSYRPQTLSEIDDKRFSGIIVLGMMHLTSWYSAIIERGSKETSIFAFGFPFAPRPGPTLADVADKLGCKVRVSLVYPEIGQAIKERKIEVIPMNISSIPRFVGNYLKSRQNTCSICSVSRPNMSGVVSFGCDAAYSRLIMDSAKFAIGEINSNQPETKGETRVSVSQFDAVVKSDESLPLLQEPDVGLVQDEIGKYVSELVEDRSTIQLGLGSIPQAVANNLRDKSDLGFHSGLLTDSIAKLIDRGIVTNRFKEILPEKSVTSLAVGFNKKFYAWLDHNEKVEMKPTTFTHDRSRMGKMNRFTAINSALQVDLLGQVNAETLGGMQVSGVGGQMDFNVGARLSKDGKSIIAIESTTKRKDASKIVPLLDKTEVVTTPRTEIDYVVTEYGTAKLEGKTISERANCLIEIAHPDFRQELRARASKLFLL